MAFFYGEPYKYWNRDMKKESDLESFKRRLCFLLTLTIMVFGTSPFFLASGQTQHEIKLVVQITVDGLRGDLLNRYGSHFGKKGFRLLLKKGTVYTNAHYQHANTETIVGHTTLATGAFPSEHGMIGNVWFDTDSKTLGYNIEDPDCPMLPSREVSTTGDQVDPSQKLSRTDGRSPKAILAPTFSDSLAAYYGGRSKIFAVSAKDRGAVPMAGQVGKAFWFSVNNGDFVTSSYYYERYPEWVKKWNALRLAEAYAGKSWSLLNDKPTYLLGAQDDRAYETDLKGFGRVFPHSFGDAGNKLLYTQILASPVGDQLLLDFSKDLIVNEALGRDEFPDYLSISFSSVDVINHFFGPSSLESEDIVVQLDHTLADLFAFVDKNVGLKHTLLILSSDHGMADMPEYMTALGFSSHRLYPDTIVDSTNEIGQKLFNIQDVVRFFYRPYLYLHEEKIQAAKLDLKYVEQQIAATLTEKEGVALAVSQSGLPPLQTTQLLKQVQNNFHHSRSGNIYIIQEPYWFLFDKGPVAGMHGSPWRYDTHVPIVFMGPDIDSQTIHRLVHPVDVSPTIAAYLGMTPPGSAQGDLLNEVLSEK
ncbi:Type I phosphodiesterase / nucleotide pyrophosphatase [Desulfoluna spongiiphila]|uniref:Type I phosphodiesterase / nucleotide pyrophosphatase n=2 Tax=Desulfoluna spongiiphila TaxID=419481 RepID=A0A1G5E8T5_9BACT|nr:Type I phosphodiesterase / nucleotide pyrophosphatase [Desulfoluna spongiiphila]